MAGKSKKEELVQKRSVQILEAAAQVFAQKGYHAATTKEIAAQAGVSEGTIYNYFQSKEDLLLSVPRLISETTALPALSQMLATPITSGEEEERLMTIVLDNAFQTLQRNVDFLKVLFSTLPTMDEETLEEYLRRMPLWLAQVLEEFLQTRIAQGVYRPMDATVVARAFMGMILIFVLTQEVLPGKRVFPPVDYDVIGREIVLLFLHGVLANPGQGEVA
ncbi:MAG: TetR/AcrR family transcriptional regulator [Anaerolineae bacterium]